MSVLISFLSRNIRVLLFLLLQILAIFFTFNTNLYHNSLVESSVISFTGFVDEKKTIITEYFNLKKENERLLEENKNFRNILAKLPEFKLSDTLNYKQKYNYTTADIVSNTLTRANNYLIINKGTAQGINVDMGVITSTGVVGMVVNSTENYSKVMSILNKYTKINARLKSSKYFGTLSWEGEDARIMRLSDIPKYVNIKIGDTIETDSKSRIYPEGILLGRVSGKMIDEESGNWNISVELFQDMGNLQKVYIVNKLDKEEIKQLQEDNVK